MLNEMFSVVRAYQTLLAAGIGLFGAAWLAPRVASEYARKREYWSRRLDFLSDLQDLMEDLRSLPAHSRISTWADITPKDTPDLERHLQRAFRLKAVGEYLYNPDSPEWAAVTLLPTFVFLPRNQHLAMLVSIHRLLEGETRKEDLLQRRQWARQILDIGQNLVSALEEADPEGGPEPRSEIQARRALQNMADKIHQRLRLWMMIRPWHWKSWYEFEKGLKKAEANLRAADRR